MPFVVSKFSIISTKWWLNYFEHTKETLYLFSLREETVKGNSSSARRFSSAGGQNRRNHVSFFFKSVIDHIRVGQVVRMKGYSILPIKDTGLL